MNIEKMKQVGYARELGAWINSKLNLAASEIPRLSRIETRSIKSLEYLEENILRCEKTLEEAKALIIEFKKFINETKT